MYVVDTVQECSWSLPFWDVSLATHKFLSFIQICRSFLYGIECLNFVRNAFPTRGLPVFFSRTCLVLFYFLL